MKPRIFYGGSFDPVHRAHIELAEFARQFFACDIEIIPAGDPALRAPLQATGQQRLHMLELACANRPGLRIDQRELRKSGRSYTIETLSDLRRELGAEQSIVWLCGSDTFIKLPQWRNWRALFEYCHWAVAPRPGSKLTGLPSELDEFCKDRWTTDPARIGAQPAGNVLILPFKMTDVSATAIRSDQANGQDTSSSLDPAVAQYIRDQGLYLPAEPDHRL